MRPSRGQLLSAAVLAIAFIAVAVISTEHERRAAPKLETLSSYDAGPGGLRAWRELLVREGVSTGVMLERPAFLPREVATLIAAPSPDPLKSAGARAQQYGRADSEALESWVRSGGHLVLVGNAHLSGALHMSILGGGVDRLMAARPAMRSALLAGVRSIEMRARLRLGERKNALLQRGEDVVAATRPIGKGRVTFVADGSALTNNRIAHADNARFAYDIVQGTRPGSIAFDEWLHGYGAERSLWSALGIPLRCALIILGVAALLGLWRAGLRLGQPITLYRPDTRTSAGYVGAIARLLARAQARGYAIASLAEPLAGRGAASRHAGREALASIAQLQVLQRVVDPTDRDVLRAAALCATLRKEYHRHAGFERAPLRAPGRRPA